MNAVTNMLHGLKALDAPGKPKARNPNEALARRQAVFDIEKHDPRGDSLLDDLAEACAAYRPLIMANYLVGDDLANGIIVRNVINALADSIHSKHPEDDER